MTVAACEVSPFCCSSFYSSQPAKFKLPAKSSILTVEFGDNIVKASSRADPKTRTTLRSDENCTHGSYGRRGLLFLATTLPFLFPIREYGGDIDVEAKELGSPGYLFMKEEIRKVLSKGKAAGVLRLAFHDAGTFEKGDNSGGMNGSIVYELDRPENKGLKKSLKILEKAKNVVDARESVSWADMIALGGAEAVSICGGPNIQIQLGRLDSMTSDPEGRLPEESFDASGLKQCFKRKGFTTQELVALSGAHTLGSKGFGNPTVFDNSYFKILLEKPWLSSAGMSSMIGLPSDRALVEDDECSRWITKYANDQDIFFEDFKDAYVKLVNSGATWKTV
ncbi:hypothetical protein Nepgr_012683 [Nepenthes gracilis]|uniref:L-ascorbate peroxidase n=1 Tax=Nepenthes gracilis TaxID=150966 RepID=A0AAD3XN02_NEPGR|nr:hypothetical protein Nepgr_012683 [Nepenthes gracilis]